MAGRRRRGPARPYRDQMDYTRLGRSGVPVSRRCLAAMNFGAITSDASARQIMDRAHEHGINSGVLPRLTRSTPDRTG